MKPSLRQSILLIDDEDEFRRVISRSLIKRGFETQEASDGKEGLRRASERPPDLILCDLSMPQMNGYEVLAALRHEEKLADIPVIFLTAQCEAAEVRQGMNLGVDDYLIKPVNILDLLAAINARLDRHQSQRQRQEKQTDRAMRLFAETIHDLRNPLFAVFAYTSLLRNAAGKPDSMQERAERLFTGMQQAATRMQDIISETMYLVRSRMKRQPLNPGVFELRNFCELLLADYEPHGRLRFHCSEGTFPVVADGPRLRHALENLLSNGLKYSDKPVVVSLTRVTARYRIEVRDRGIGIPVKDQPSIFEPFFRASNTGGKPGHGLGLCVVKSCIEEHGGSIHFVSKPNQGTTFLIDLPTAPPDCVQRQRKDGDFPISAKLPEPANLEAGRDSVLSVTKVEVRFAERAAHILPKPPESQQSESRFDTEARPREAFTATVGELRAIVVDDDPVVRNVMRELLESSNHVQIVGEAGTVAQARLLARQERPSVVFLDVNLPDGSGFDLLPDLGPNISVIFVTSAEEYAAQAFDCEATDYLVKPVTSERLQKALLRVRQRMIDKTPAASPVNPKSTGSFLVKTLTEKRMVKISEIKSIIAFGEYSWVYWNKGEKGALLRKSLNRWQSEVPGEHFLRVHRRAIVNLTFLDRVERLPAGRLQIFLRDMPEPILVSLSQTPMVNRMLKALRT
jgi:two-component system sensor histidine kinase/response regulator